MVSHFFPGLIGLVAPIILYLLSPFITGAFGLTALNSLQRALLAANTVYVPVVFALSWAFATQSPWVGPAASIGSVLGVAVVTLIMNGKGISPLLMLGFAVTVVGAIIVYYALQQK